MNHIPDSRWVCAGIASVEVSGRLQLSPCNTELALRIAWFIISLLFPANGPFNGSCGDSSMARVTVEDCMDYVDNRFDLVLLATKRARQLANGVEPLLPWENDKPTVMALREIAEGLISHSEMDKQAAEEEMVVDDTLINIDVTPMESGK